METGPQSGGWDSQKLWALVFTTLDFLKSCQPGVPTLPRAFRPTMGPVQQGQAGDTPEARLLGSVGSRSPSQPRAGGAAWDWWLSGA